MLDFHSHFLPNLDDGSKSIEESRRLLEMLLKQGINQVVATPHFYAHQNSPERFLRKRQESLERLEIQAIERRPQIYLGAEVYYFDGMSRIDELSSLRVEGTPLLLVEMPFEKWSNRWLQEVLSIQERPDFTVVLAHIERYLGFGNEDALDELLAYGVKAQVNSEFFLKWTSRRKALQMLDQNRIHFLGSDCHNLDTRPPRIGEARAYIRQKRGNTGLSLIREHEWEYFPMGRGEGR